MPRPAQKQPRKFVVRAQKTFQGSRYDAYQRMAVLLAAAGIENVSVGLKEDKDGKGCTVKLWIPDDPIECWLELYEDLEGQIKTLILEAWGRDTYNEARAVVALGGAESDAEGPIGDEPTRRTRKGGSGA